MVQYANKREHPRVSTRIEAKLKLPDGRTHTTGQILNLSLGGIFIEMEQPLGFGSEVDIEFALPKTTIRCKGLVVWSTKTAPERAVGRSGMGLRLMQIGVSQMRELAEYIQERLP